MSFFKYLNFFFSILGDIIKSCPGYTQRKKKHPVFLNLIKSKYLNLMSLQGPIKEYKSFGSSDLLWTEDIHNKFILGPASEVMQSKY